MDTKDLASLSRHSLSLSLSTLSLNTLPVSLNRHTSHLTHTSHTSLLLHLSHLSHLTLYSSQACTLPLHLLVSFTQHDGSLPILSILSYFFSFFLCFFFFQTFLLLFLVQTDLKNTQLKSTNTVIFPNFVRDNSPTHHCPTLRFTRVFCSLFRMPAPVIS